MPIFNVWIGVKIVKWVLAWGRARAARGEQNFFALLDDSDHV